MVLALLSFVIFDGLYAPTCDLDQQIPIHTLRPKIQNASAVIDFAPSYCYQGRIFINQGNMQKFIMRVGWDAHFCLGEAAIRTSFFQDAYGCGEHGGLIVFGPSLQVYVRNNGK